MEQRSKQAPCCFVACTPKTSLSLLSQSQSNTVGKWGKQGLPFLRQKVDKRRARGQTAPPNVTTLCFVLS
eukprot:6093107-Ditylum_brightwellii.AAC.1